MLEDKGDDQKVASVQLRPKKIAKRIRNRIFDNENTKNWHSFPYRAQALPKTLNSIFL